METAREYIKKIGIDVQELHPSIGDAFLSKAVYFREDKALDIHLEPKEVIVAEELSKLQDHIRLKLDWLERVRIKVFYKDFAIGCPDKDFRQYIENLACYINCQLRSFNCKPEDIQWDRTCEKLDIAVSNQFMLDVVGKKRLQQQLGCLIAEQTGIYSDVEFVAQFNNMDSRAEKMAAQKEEEAHEIAKMKLSQTAVPARKERSAGAAQAKQEGGLNSALILGKKISGEAVKISELRIEGGTSVIEGKVFNTDSRELKNGKRLLIFSVTDYTSSVTCKAFLSEKQKDAVSDEVKKGSFLRIRGEAVYDSYSKEMAFNASDIEKSKPVEKSDDAPVKRVELHAHTQMSAMDAVVPVGDIIKRAASWGHKAVAITDHGVAQAFPDAMSAAQKCGIKVIYGVEGYLVNDNIPLISQPNSLPLSQEFVVFDLETTGLSNTNDRITEIGAVKIRDFEIVDRFSCFVNPERDIPLKIQELTGISAEMVKDAPTIEQALPDFLSFARDSILVAHNADFDIGFVRESCKRIGLEFESPYVDTLRLAKALLPQLKRYKLDVIAKNMGISLNNHHRAIDDAEATARIYLKFLEELKKQGIQRLDEVNFHFKQTDYKKLNTYHVTILVKNQEGLKNLYKLISKSHIDYFYKRPRIPKTLLTKYREGLLVGSACEAGELYQAVLRNADEGELRPIAEFYDYYEIMPIENNSFMVEKGIVSGRGELEDINRRIIEIGERAGKLVVATGDVHYLDEHEAMYRNILQHSQGYSDNNDTNPLYFKTTGEMLADFEYLGEELASRVVIENTNRIADMVDDVKAIPDETFPPRIEGADEDLRNMCYEKACSIYGNPLPEIVEKRLERELKSIISNGYAVMYIIAQKLVTKSLEDGYLVGSRGSVGSSLAATMSDITEVNPLPPHYVCPSCKSSEFITDGSYGSGADLPDKDCPKCGDRYLKDGHDIPFEVFLGFEGDKEPDIDLNFAGEYQATAHKYTEVLFGKGYVYKAGTIGTIADKTAYGFVKKYVEENNITCTSAEIERLSGGCTGIKRTSGQHPGGIMVVPDYKEIYDFCPIQYPANDPDSGVITTHFDYHAISGRLLKLDILGHDTPTIIKMLEELTGLDATKIPLDDAETMSLFSATTAVGVSQEELNSTVATFAVPEFGTKFVRQMLVDTMPTTFAELVRISGLSHGTDVWLNNAQEYVRKGVAELKEVISTRDDIMNYLILKGVPPKQSFKIMEKIRKGKGLNEEDEAEMKKNSVPQWYIDSCNKIKYMFPKAHAVAYVMMSFRIAYFKVHYPRAFYATYFTTKAEDFDITLILRGKGAIEERMREIESLGNSATAKEKNLYTLLEVVKEMYLRGIEILNVDIYTSDARKFKIKDGKLLPPLLALPGLGENAALNIVSERKQGEFLSLEDMRYRTKVSKTVIELMVQSGCVGDMPETNQLSLL